MLTILINGRIEVYIRHVNIANVILTDIFIFASYITEMLQYLYYIYIICILKI